MSSSLHKESRTEFRRRNKDLFKGYTFKFEHFPSDETDGYEKIVKDFGAEVTDKADYIFSQIEDHSRKRKVYSTCYILHSIRAEEPLDIEKFSVQKKDVFCELCLKEFEIDSDSEITPNSCSKNKVHNEASMKIKPVMEKNTRSHISTISTKKSSKKICKNDDSNSSTSELSSDEELHTSNSKDNKTINKVITNKKAKLSSKGNFARPKIKKERNYEVSDSDSSIFAFSSDEETNISNYKNWWLPCEFSKKELCKIQSCTMEPNPHLKHGNFRKHLSLQERRVMLTYFLKTNNQVHQLTKVCKEMHKFGYLTHRTVETLRNCMRRRILPNIDEYDLPSAIKERFLGL